MLSVEVKLGEGFENVVFGASDDDTRVVWVFRGVIESIG